MNEMPAVYQCDHPKARKEHRCYECGGVIKVGERYNLHHGIWDGRAETFKVCTDCDALRSALDKGNRYYEEQTAFGYVAVSVMESGSRELAAECMRIKNKRGAEVHKWLREQAEGATK